MTGRPAIILPDLCDDWELRMFSIYAEGGSDAEVQVALARPGTVALSKDLWYGLQERNPEFSDAAKRGHALAEAWWAAAGRDGMMMGKEFNATAYIFNMKNRFNYGDGVDGAFIGIFLTK